MLVNTRSYASIDILQCMLQYIYIYIYTTRDYAALMGTTDEAAAGLRARHGLLARIFTGFVGCAPYTAAASTP